MIDMKKRSYEVKLVDKRFVTVCRIDGFWAAAWASRTRRRAEWKGQEFVAFRRNPAKVVWHTPGFFRG